jgi:putative salt-induced outer membrane protein
MVKRLILLSALFPMLSYSDEVQEPYPLWQNEVDVGMLFYSGNNNAKHLNGSLSSEFTQDEYMNQFRASGLLSVGKNNKTRDKERNAEKYILTDTFYYALSTEHFAYIRGEAIRDHFSAFRYEVTQSVGFGYSFFNAEHMMWSMSGGPGTRQSKIDVTREQRNEWIGHIESQFYYEMTKLTSFKQNISIDMSSLNTKTRSLNELKTSLFGPVAAKFSFELENYTKLPPQSKYKRKTDATTKVTLSYSF